MKTSAYGVGESVLILSLLLVGVFTGSVLWALTAWGIFLFWNFFLSIAFTVACWIFRQIVKACLFGCFLLMLGLSILIMGICVLSMLV